jgi:hypothetical protein
MITDQIRSCSLILSGRALDVGGVSELLRQRPDRSFSVGDKFLAGGREVERASSMWALDSEKHIRSPNPLSHLKFIAIFVKHHAGNIEKLRASGATARLRFHWYVEKDVLSFALDGADMCEIGRLVDGIDVSIV